MPNSQSKRIVLTGVSRGLGLAMTRGFIELGHIVHGCGRSAEQIQDRQDEFPSPHTFHVVDVQDDDAVQAWAEEILSIGTPDLLINNAAIMNHNNPLWEVPYEEFVSLININITGTFSVVRHFVPAMIANDSGVIVNFSSTWGRSTSPEVAPYCASKFAIEGLTKSLAQELPSTMAAIPFNPGIINTEMLQTCFGSGVSSYPTPDQWAEQAVPLLLGLGPENSGVSMQA